MREFKRIVTVDRSLLAQHIYEVILRPLGISLFSFQTLRKLKETPPWDLGVHLLLVNSNTFGHYLENHLSWFQEAEEVVPLPKIFLCDSGEKKIVQTLKSVPNSQILFRPFYPPELEKKIDASLST